ncbi:hypothetical protein J2Z69_002355 [Paenibacillus shirakamiensis]|uniref:Phosphodiester glycosidase domain-containing protein n=2 Tax=Paenibacillus shirakamiensis TaxID=1265935 RepID=A0ABS4JHW8_9BACL|nr:hypothetical protein [Paenibacillus shirakamiensis]
MISLGSQYIKHEYRYAEHTASNGVILQALILKPEQVGLKAVNAPLQNESSLGMNGGFFFGTDILSIAVQNDLPVKGTARTYGTGWYNVKYPRGTLVWDDTARRFSVQVVSSADDLLVKNRNRYFAQGGISMNLMHENSWQSAIDQEKLPYPLEQRLRSGLVYDEHNQLWLIVTPSRATAAEFRSAIQEQIAPGRSKEGIFLDGDGSSQLNVPGHNVLGDSRDLRQIISLK